MRIPFLLALICWASASWADSTVLEAINQERSAQDRAPLVYDARLEMAARAHAEDMVRAGFFSHTGSDGSDLAQRLKRAGYAGCFGAENIAAGQRNLAEVMQSWMQSRGHRRNILHRKAQAVGVARADGNHWVMVLGAPC
ncbi:MAG: CAP domain-containing protein [Tateyamaria sp.]